MISHLHIFLSLFLFSTITISSSGQNPERKSFDWIDLQTAQTLSAEDGKPLFVFVEAEWCGFCKKMKAEVFPDNDVSNYLDQNYHSVLIDLGSKEEVIFNDEVTNERNFAREMQVMQTPTIIFIDRNGEVLGKQPGFLDSNELVTLLNYVLSDDFGSISFEEYSSSPRN